MDQSQHYHNTTQQPKNFVVEETKKAISQEEKVLELFKVHKKLSASQVFNNFYNTPITSIRRAISNLSFENKLQKLHETKIGLYGKPEHFYKIIEN